MNIGIKEASTISRSVLLLSRSSTTSRSTNTDEESVGEDIIDQKSTAEAITNEDTVVEEVAIAHCMIMMMKSVLVDAYRGQPA